MLTLCLLSLCSLAFSLSLSLSVSLPPSLCFSSSGAAEKPYMVEEAVSYNELDYVSVSCDIVYICFIVVILCVFGLCQIVFYEKQIIF